MWCRSLVGVALLAWSLACTALEPLVAEATVNGVADGVIILMKDEDGGFYVTSATLDRWRLVADRPPPRVENGESWHALSAVTGVRATFDSALLKLDVHIPPELLPTTRVGAAPEIPLPSAPDSGAFLDYQWGYAAAAGDQAPDLWSLSLDPTFFGPAGHLTSGLIWRKATGSTPGAGEDDGLLRLDTTWTTDDPRGMRSFRVGDSVTLGAAWQRTLRFGGFQVARNFATRPRMSTVPQPALKGTAVLPSRVEILIDGQSRGAADLPPGSWALDQVPITTGAGELTVVTTDLAGRRQEQVLDFYASPRQLRPGLTDFAVSVGWAREDFGFESFDYGEAFASLSYRRGQSARLTWETAAELTGDFSTLGLGGSYAWPRVGLASVSVAVSHSDEVRTGGLWQLGWERRARVLSLSAAVQGASRDFRQLGIESDDQALRRQGLASIGLGLGDLGSLSLTLAHQEPYEGGSRTFSQLGLTRTLRNGLSVSTFWRHTTGEGGTSLVGVNFNWRVGQRDSAGAGFSVEDDRWDASAEYRRDLPVGGGVGYRLRSAAGSARRSEATFNVNTASVRWDADVRQSDTGTEWSAFAGGSLVWLDTVHAARQVRDSFAVVDTAGVPGVRVYWENQPVGQTDDDGRLLVPMLRPFDANKLSIDVRDPPIASEVGRSTVEAVPYGGAGMAVNFGIRSLQPATLRVLREDGSPVPAGAVAHRPGVEGTWPVGYAGRLYLPDTAGVTEIHLRWQGEECTAVMPEAERTGPIPHLGDALCRAQP